MSEGRAGGLTPKAGESGDREGHRRRLPPEARRAEVLQAALEVFAEVGFERATLQDVADRAGVTKGALYHYFDSKDELFLGLMSERVAALVAASQALVAAAEPTKPREALLRELLEAMWSNLRQPGMLDFTRLLMTELPKFPECGRAFFDELVVPARRTLRRALDRDDTATGGHGALIEAVVALLPSMMLGVALTRQTFQGIDPADLDADRTGAIVVEVLLRGTLATVEAGRAR
jgi:AcrR family transcriptional regulator